VSSSGPQVGVGAVVVHQGRVLLVQRGRPPGEGLWAIPGGRQRLGETLQQAAEREIREEYVSGAPQAGDDASAARWVAWSELAALPLNASSRTALATLFPAEAGAQIEGSIQRRGAETQS
jgi:ADP-ribose pyrophosphatase